MLKLSEYHIVTIKVCIRKKEIAYLPINAKVSTKNHKIKDHKTITSSFSDFTYSISYYKLKF